MNPFNTFVNNLKNKSKTTSSFGISSPSTSSTFRPTATGIKNTAYPTPTGQPVNQTTPSNVGATSTKPTAITSPMIVKTGNLPPAGKQFAQNLYDASTGARTAFGASQGATDMLGGKPVTTTEAKPTTTAPTSTDSPYMTYLKSMFDPEALKTAQGNITALNERTASELQRTRTREDELRKNEIGQLERGQNYQLGEEERLSNRSLADLAIAKGASIDTLNQIMGAGKEAYGEQKPIEIDGALYQKQSDGTYKVVAGTPGGAAKTGSEAGFTLSPGEKRYDAQGKLIASGGEKPLSATAEAKALEKGEKEVAAQQSATQSIGLVNSLLNSDRYKSISGATQTGSIPFFGDRAAVNEYDQLQGLLKLGIRGLLKGQGAVSDYEGKVLGQAASSLSRLTSEEQMKSALQKVRGVLKTNNGQSTEVIIRDKEGKILGTGLLDGNDIYEAVNDGNTVEYL